ncbi:hypothetical protein CDL12_27942 [Handroanthus impetiginosus]|uniref:Uncharacterized protein n=1 Tax=Handroanthus impetiginosus TaxID=429701 RepID=A0A2G9G3S4_9LAMI|nr:hypothetical protein CDL12_27942 [Handroanthus impetiginosus]
MMGFGPMGSGAGGNFSSSSSSSSSLSASAPPFTVDRLNPKPNSNPLLHYSDLTYVEPFSHTWQYARPSAPRPEMGIDSTGINSVPLANDYQFSASVSISPSSTPWSALSPVTKASGSAFGYGCEVEPYHSPYVPPMVGEDGLLIEDEGARYNVGSTSGVSVKSQIDYSNGLFDLEYGPRWIDSLGFDEGKRAKRAEIDGSFFSEKANVAGSHSYTYQVNQGGQGTENWSKCREDSGISYKKFNRSADREAYTGSSTVGHMEDKSCLEHNLGLFPYDSNTYLSASSSNYPESHPSIIPSEVHKNFSNYQDSYGPYEKCVRPADKPFTGHGSVIRSSPTVVIRPPPPATNGQTIVSRKPARSGSLGAVRRTDFDHSSPSKQKDSGLKSSYEIKEDLSETNLFNFTKQGNGLVSLTPAKQLSNPQLFKDTSDRKVKGRFLPQLPDIKVSGGVATACDIVQVVPTEGSSGFVDHQNLAVDSPCWKGATSPQFSAFDIEAGSSDHVKKNLDEYYGFECEKLQNLQSIVNYNRGFSEKVEGDKKNEDGHAGNDAVLTLERTLDAISSSKERSSLDDAKGGDWISTLVNSKGAEISDDSNMPRKESGLLNNLTSGFDIKVSVGEEGSGMTLNDVCEGGAVAVAVHAAEKVLASPASQEDATECTKLPDRNLNHGAEKVIASSTSQEGAPECDKLQHPNLNVLTMIKAIHNLSELLLLHLSNDAYSLEEENTETIKKIICNLDSCFSEKTVPASNKPEPKIPMGDTSEKLGESRNVGIISGSPRATNEAVNSPIKLDHCYKHEVEKKHSPSGKKDEKSPIFSPLRDDLDIARDDDTSKAIKKVLEENFHFDEQMHSQALLFKSLWLEAEAKLCSISYKARFDRMKIQMEEVKLKAPQENEDLAEMMPDVFIAPISPSELAPKAHDSSILKPTLQNTTSGHADDIDTSVMARFNILKSREDNMKPINTEEDQEPELLDGVHADSIMARLNILKSREGNSKSIMEEEQLETVHGEFSDDPIIHSFDNSRMNNQNNWGWHDSSSSSEWEHVVKDDFSWKNL